MYYATLYSSKKADAQADKFRQRQTNHWERRIAAVMERCGDLNETKVLDLGCGVGTFALVAMESCARWAIGLDSSLEMLAEAKILSGELEGTPHFVRADVLAVPLRRGTVDLIICADLIEHLRPGETVSFLRECWRLLASGGNLVLHTWPTRYSYLFETWPSLFLWCFASLRDHQFEKAVQLTSAVLRVVMPKLEQGGLGFSVGHPNLMTKRILEKAAWQAGFAKVKIESLNLYRGFAVGENGWRRKSQWCLGGFDSFCPNLLLSATK